jgi:hypothetical protein
MSDYKALIENIAHIQSNPTTSDEYRVKLEWSENKEQGLVMLFEAGDLIIKEYSGQDVEPENFYRRCYFTLINTFIKNLTNKERIMWLEMLGYEVTKKD